MDVLQTLKSERDRAQKELNRLDAAIKALGGSTGTQRSPSQRSSLNAAARARIAAAQRARWARARANKGQKQNVVSMSKPKQKTMSAVARRKIAAAQRARWAKIKAAKKARK